ncbi:MAG: alternative ribosome rescue aminoacyl-tRNA hydrolase ArfB [Bacteroidales bacterium]|jgi:ribosome-associated protein|nr:alternative ribosome rescue aminoacyl-tRNA hydrolase ArfB [Bacteroidales bacterium]
MSFEINIPAILEELSFKTSRSGGKGGQHVNKTETKVQLAFDIRQSAFLTDDEKERLIENAANLLTKDEVLQMACETSRSQSANKAELIERFIEVLRDALKEEKPRKETKVPKVEKKKRLENKRKLSEKKQYRKPPEPPV